MECGAIKTKKYSVYAFRCIPNGKMYIGVTMNVESRLATHMRGAKPGSLPEFAYTASQEDKNFLEKCTHEDFEFYILEENIDYDDRHLKETEYIDKYKTWDPRYGYNEKHFRKYKYQNVMRTGLPPLHEELIAR